MANYEHVLSPFQLGNVTVKNRIELSPACYMLTSPEGFVTREMVAYYENFARGGVGIVTIGETPIDFEYAKGHEFQLNMADNRVINGLSLLVEAVHRHGAKLSIELAHLGRFVLNNRPTIGPSPIPARAEIMNAAREGRKVRPVKEMDKDLIDSVIEHFADAAFRCLRAGFEMIMIHGAHGHLISQFLSPYTNKRTDQYGGSLENRARFAIEVLTAIRKKIGNKMAIEYRISSNELVPGGMEEEDTIEFVKMIEDKIDLLHVSAGILSEPQTVPHIIQPTYFPHCHNVHRAGIMKKALKVPIATVGSITDMNMAEEIVATGKADIVAMARAILADPQIVKKTSQGRVQDVRPCLRCHTCNKLTANFYPIRCAVNPTLGREFDYAEILPAREKKRVVVVGGGPGGMQAALTASSRGHEVVLFEKTDQLGGNLLLAAGLEIKEDMRRYLSWLIRQTEQAPGVTIKLNNEATVEKIEAEKPDALIIAVGSDPIIPEVPGINKPHVVWVGDVDLGRKKTGKSVLVIGGGSTGGEAALQLAKDGKRVTIIDLLKFDELMLDWPRGLSMLLDEYGVTLLGETKLEEISDKGAVVIDKNWKRYEIEVDTVILSLGFKPRSQVAADLGKTVRDTYLVGDCIKPQTIKQAVHDGFNVAVEL